MNYIQCKCFLSCNLLSLHSDNYSTNPSAYIESISLSALCCCIIIYWCTAFWVTSIRGYVFRSAVPCFLELWFCQIWFKEALLKLLFHVFWKCHFAKYGLRSKEGLRADPGYGNELLFKIICKYCMHEFSQAKHVICGFISTKQ